jgi:hypothetical protein
VLAWLPRIGSQPYDSHVVTCRLILHYPDGHVGETEVRGDGPIVPGSFFKLPPVDEEQWWKVMSVRWLAGRDAGEADLEPTELPPHLAKLEQSA